MAPITRKRIVEPTTTDSTTNKNIDLLQKLMVTSTEAKAIKESLRNLRELTTELELKLAAHIGDLDSLMLGLEKKLPKRSKLEESTSSK